MRARIVVGVGAWLLGAAAATGGSLLAVSLLGQGIAYGHSQQQLTSEAVNRALAGALAERSAGARHGLVPVARQAASPGSSPSLSPAAGALLASAGGTVVARCPGDGAYLVSWSPQQRYEASAVVRGPAPTAKVTFSSAQNTLTMVVTCASGTPTATSYGRRPGKGNG